MANRRLSGLKALHQIDAEISKTRKQLARTAKMPGRASDALVALNRKQLTAYEDIAKVRLTMIEDGEGGVSLGSGSLGSGSLGYVDRQAAKLLSAHAKEEARMAKKADASLARIAKLEQARRQQESLLVSALKAYDKSAEACRKILLSDPDYVALEKAEAQAQAMTERARAKQELTEEDVGEKGMPYRDDPYFNYLQKRGYGTKKAKGWFLTKWFDGILARRGDYREAALNYQRLLDIPVRLVKHVEDLSEKHAAIETKLDKAERAVFVREGATKLRTVADKASHKLEKIDTGIAAYEDEHQAVRSEQAKVGGGDSAPYRQAVKLLVDTLTRKDIPSLKRLAVQTMSLDDDRAITRLMNMSREVKSLRLDLSEAKKLVAEHQFTLNELEQFRRDFKSRRYDVPPSEFSSAKFVGSISANIAYGVLSGMVASGQMQRDHSRSTRRRTSGGWGGGRSSGGGWSGGGSSSSRSRRSSSSRRSGGGFRTGGGF